MGVIIIREMVGSSPESWSVAAANAALPRQVCSLAAASTRPR